MSILSFSLSLGIFVLATTHDDTCYDKFEYVFKVMHRLSKVEKKLESNRQGDTFTRWGKSTCPNGTVLIYDGFAGGSDHLSIGGAANHICLHNHPTWNDQTKYKSRTNLIYGAEYQTHDTNWRALHDYEVPFPNESKYS
ncbi:uncharacterized protein LOC132750689 [Ruditapes philippinarum]|uniref:uncharacterized protein LOC132750689 n=1 Tax=Ruditapes philippinarum TaxID=129788 RepID=UPI00295C15D0|nr:uncharacterized protein LOC132750689 [Ruditapes philippinarum]